MLVQALDRLIIIIIIIIISSSSSSSYYYHSTACIVTNYELLGELKILRAQSVGEVIA